MKPHGPPVFYGRSVVEAAVKDPITLMAKTLMSGDRIEIRGFGSFSLRRREPRVGRNPKTGAAVPVAAHHLPHFKPGKALRQQVQDRASKS